ncbi:MAG: DUF3808 domain-containing protein [Ignavibacteriae bacterium]|nr:DUF3808 domain-containing protein [Ignavibacteriota bacterium]
MKMFNRKVHGEDAKSTKKSFADIASPWRSLRLTIAWLTFCIVFLAQIVFSIEKATLDRINSLTLEGLNLAYNFELEQANAKFEEALRLEPNHPRPHVSKATILFWRFALANDDQLYDELIPLLEQSIEAAEEYQDENESDADALTCLGSLYGYKAFAHARQKSYLKAAWDGKNSLDFFTDAVQQNPKAYDAYLGLGTFHYFAAFAPKALQWVISILGVDGDATLGVKEIRLALERGTFTNVEAQYYLAQFLPWQSGNFHASESLLVDLSKRFPNNSIISFTLAIWEMRRNDVSSARVQLQTIVQSEKGLVPGLKPLSLYKLAECNYRLSNFQNAIDGYKAFLAVYRDENYQATAHHRIGVSYELTGRREQALKHYRASIAAEHRHGDDKYSSRKSEAFLKSSITVADSILLTAKNICKAGDYPKAKELYSMLDSLAGVSSTHRAEAHIGIGELLIEQELYAEALAYFNNVVMMNVGSEQWLIPWSHYQLGVCHSKLGNTVVAKKEFERVLEFDEEYDFKNWLTFRTERELERLK